MRVTRTWTISLPPQMSAQAYQLAKQEHRTKSELVREALRVYFSTHGRLPAPSAGERLSRVGELADIYRQRYPAHRPNEAELRRSFRGIRRLHNRLKHLSP
jgi:predicted transcriptional regulator